MQVVYVASRGKFGSVGRLYLNGIQHIIWYVCYTQIVVDQK